MIWPFGNSEERKQKKRAKQARAFYEDAMDQLEAQQYDKALDLLEQAKEFGHADAEAKMAEIHAMFDKVEESNTISKVMTTLQCDMVRYAPKNNAVRDYIDLTDELLRKGVL